MSRKPPEDAPQPSQDSASLVRRLAGASVTKAGLTKDQTEINKIIAEVSKGSKFYENEKRKDKELTEKIERILKIKDDMLKVADIAGVESEADRILEELESERDLSQYIVHVDMDAFYASVELLLNPDLAGKPFGVGRGVLSTASYDARKYGVRSGMAEFVARKLCPELIFVPLTIERYSEKSKEVMTVFKQYDPNMIVAGCDEGYLNITPYCEEHGLTPDECIEQMRRQVQIDTKLTASAGIAPNKMLAKICSDKNKPNGQFHLPFERDAIKVFMAELPIRKLPGVGRVHERLLDSIGVKTCGDIYAHRAAIHVMDKYFDRNFLFKAYLGIASNVVQPHTREEVKSIGAERTFRSMDDQAKILQKLEEVANELEQDMQSSGWVGRTVTLKYKLDTYQVFTRAKALDRWISKKEDLYNIGKELIKPEFPLCIRLIGLRVTKLKDLRLPDNKGIKRFFQANTSTGHDRPSKKPRLEALHDDTHCLNEVIDVDDDDLDASLMLLNHEANDEGVDGRSHLLGLEHHNDPPQPSTSKSTLFDIPPPPPAADPSSSDTTAPRTQTCPICSKELETDNLGLNAHIDFCLSKGAIMEATGSASVRTAKTAKPSSSSSSSAKPTSFSMQSWTKGVQKKQPGSAKKPIGGRG